jgi:hydrogenase maturation protease
LIRTLILGYGNPDREDDGVAWHILMGLARRLNRTIPEDFSEGFFATNESPDLVFVLQLTPELSETLAEYERVCLVDAHTGNIPDEVRFVKVDAQFQTSPFTHHLTPQSLLSMTDALFHINPETILVSVHGYQFGFAQSLSPQTANLAHQAEELIWNWITQEENTKDTMDHGK